jgi:hypothetical protein
MTKKQLGWRVKAKTEHAGGCSSPVRLTTRPSCTAMVGSIRSLRSARSRASVRSSSEPAEADYIRRQNRGKFPSLGHKVPSQKSIARRRVSARET